MLKKHLRRECSFHLMFLLSKKGSKYLPIHPILDYHWPISCIINKVFCFFYNTIFILLYFIISLLNCARSDQGSAILSISKDDIGLQWPARVQLKSVASPTRALLHSGFTTVSLKSPCLAIYCILRNYS